MSEPIWTSKPIVQPVPDEFEYTATIEGLVVKVKDHRGWVRWEIDGFYQDIPVFAHYSGLNRKRTVEDAKVEAVDAAQRLYAGGWRGEKAYPVSCCDRLLPTRADAERHEADHKAELGYLHYSEDAENPGGSVCGHWATQWTVTDDPAAVTCPACREWVGENLIVKVVPGPFRAVEVVEGTAWAVVDSTDTQVGDYFASRGMAERQADAFNALERAVPVAGDSEHAADVVAREQARRGRDASEEEA